VEGFPNAIIESMAAGVPVVAAAVGGVPELIEDGRTGRLVHSRNPADFADAIDQLLEHPDEAENMAREAGAHVRAHLTTEAMVDGYRSLYNELLAKAFRSGG
jgi:glycosyltransferase involved in cell wall biosynthesis